MAAQEQDLTAEQGATFRQMFNILTPIVPTPTSGPLTAPQDLTGCSAIGQIRSAYNAQNVIATISTETGEIVLGGIAGTLEIQLAAAATLALYVKYGTSAPTDQAYVYDVFLTFPTGDVRKILFGAFNVISAVTRT